MNNLSFLPFLALSAGAAIAIQASMNAYVGVLLKNVLFSTMIAFSVSGLIILFSILVSNNNFPSIVTLKSIPIYLWLSGMLSAFGVCMFYYLIPKMGIGSMMSYALTGQIIIAIIISHFGWFELPIKPISALKLLGCSALTIGIVLVNWE